MIKKRLYIECKTCKHTNNCVRSRSVLCLIIKTGFTEKIIFGERWVSVLNYEYVLWEPVNTVLLEDDLFEI